MPSANPQPSRVLGTNTSGVITYYSYAEMLALLGGSGSGSVTSIENTDGSLVLTPNPITSTGTIAINTYNSNQWEGQQNFDNISLQYNSYCLFNGTSDLNWRIGLIDAFTTTYVGASTTIQIVIGTGSSGPDGFAIGQTGGTSIAEFRGYDLASFLNGTLQVADTVTLSSLAGSGSGIVAVDNSGNLSWSSSSGGANPSLVMMYVSLNIL